MPAPTCLRVLLVADTHLGFDHAVRPKVERRRRGHDFLANYRRVCRAAIEERVDLMVHGGDVFHRPDVPPSLVHQAFEPLEKVAAAGIPVCLVAGNHERSRIPFDRLARRPGVHVFRQPTTVQLSLRGVSVAVSGMPCIRRDARTRFARALERTGWSEVPSELRLLVVHQAFEGAVVGPADFTFRYGHDVVRMADVAPGFAAVLAGHIHRSQVLDTDLRGRPVPVPVLYPGSIERTAFAERGERKGYMVLELSPGRSGGRVRSWAFRDLGARPMEIRPLKARGLGPGALDRELRKAIGAVPADTVLRLEADGAPNAECWPLLSAHRIRSVAPETMNVEVIVPGMRRRRGPRRAARPSKAARTRGVARNSNGEREQHAPRSSTPGPGRASAGDASVEQPSLF